MARRIELPSADVLFGDEGGAGRRGARKSAAGRSSRRTEGSAAKKTPAKKASPKTSAARTTAAKRTAKKTVAKKPTTAAHQSARGKPAGGGATTSRRRAAKTGAPAARSSAPATRPHTNGQRARRTPTPLQQLESIEARLAELPVDALIDLRDGLEELLSADGIDEQAVRRLLDSVDI